MATVPPLPPPPPKPAPTHAERRAVWSGALISAIGCETFDDFDHCKNWADDALDAFDEKFGMART